MFSIEPEITKISRKKTLPDRFNHLLAMTYSLNDSADIWIHDNEGILYTKICYVKQSIDLNHKYTNYISMYTTGWCDGELEHAIKKLAGAWKRMLKRSNAELGIDAEYTRPGVEALLEKFEGVCNDFDGRDLSFKWK